MRIVAPMLVQALWWFALGLTVVVIVPVALYLLHRTWKAARNIRRYTTEALEAGVGIVENTARVGALDETVALAGPLLEKAGELEEAAARVADTLNRRAS